MQKALPWPLQPLQTSHVTILCALFLGFSSQDSKFLRAETLEQLGSIRPNTQIMTLEQGARTSLPTWLLCPSEWRALVGRQGAGLGFGCCHLRGCDHQSVRPLWASPTSNEMEILLALLSLQVGGGDD